MRKQFILSRKNNGVVLPAQLSELRSAKGVKVVDTPSRLSVLVEGDKDAIKDFMKRSRDWEARPAAALPVAEAKPKIKSKRVRVKT